MGGKNEETINGLRFHISNSDVHVHDDIKNLRFEINCEDFKKETNQALKQFKSDGIIKINGNTKESLCLVQDNRDFYMFITDGQSTKQKLKNFLKGY